MREYLLNIAARSSGNSPQEMLPSMAVFGAAQSGNVDDFSEENNNQEVAGQNQFVQQSMLLVQPVSIQPAQQSLVLSRTENKEEGKSIEPTYFSKHIERVETEVESNPVKNNNSATINYKNEQLLRKKGIEKIAVKHYESEPGLFNKSIAKIAPEIKVAVKQESQKSGDNFNEAVQEEETISVIKPRINPLIKDEVQKENGLKQSSSRIQRLTPSHQDIKPAGPVHRNQINQPAPKLVIGKIVVEILPPKLPVPQKVITRVVPPPANDGHSKSNKLIFGLRQL
jgi:hypothetical protein